MQIPVKEKMRLVLLGIAGAIFGLLPVALGIFGLINDDKKMMWDIITIAFGGFICLVTVIYIARTVSDYRKDMPRQDERSIRVICSAARSLRSAILTVLEIASGWSGNRASISSPDFM